MTCRKCHRDIYARGLCQNCYPVERRKLIAYGRWDPFYDDPAQVQDHLAELRSWGMGLRRVEELTGLCRPALQELPTVTKVSRNTRDLILGIPIPTTVFDTVLADGTQISVIGTQRRLQGLARMGWSAEMLAARVGCDRRRLAAFTSGQQTKVTVRWARQVAELFNELHMVPGPGRKAARFAELKGWAFPLAWDEDAIDRRTSRPKHGSDRRGGFVERVAELRTLGLASITDINAIAERLGQDPESVKRQITRHRQEIAS